jgi:HEAT repeat protein
LHAATALGNFNDLRAVNALIQVLGDDDATLYIFAEQSLEKQGPLSIDPLIAALKNGSGRIRQVAIRLLWEAKATKAIDPLVELLTRDPDHAQRKEAATALKFLGWKPGEDAAGAAYWVCEGDWEHCIQMGSLAVEPLVAILNSNDEKVNIQVVRALGDIADPRAVEPLIMAMRSYPTELEASLALVKIYRSGNIGEAQKNIILQHKEEITKQRHRDFHDDGDCPKGHTDYGKDIFSL